MLSMKRRAFPFSFRMSREEYALWVCVSVCLFVCICSNCTTILLSLHFDSGYTWFYCFFSSASSCDSCCIFYLYKCILLMISLSQCLNMRLWLETIRCKDDDDDNNNSYLLQYNAMPKQTSIFFIVMSNECNRCSMEMKCECLH